MESLALGPRGLQCFNEYGEPRRVDVGNGAQIQDQIYASFGFQPFQQECAQAGRRINGNPASQADPACGPEVLAYGVNVFMERH